LLLEIQISQIFVLLCKFEKKKKRRNKLSNNQKVRINKYMNNQANKQLLIPFVAGNTNIQMFFFIKKRNKLNNNQKKQT
jgi:hypothetical protein